MPLTLGLVAYMAIINVVAFAAFGVDKSRARRGAWRIPEITLMLLAVAGGSAGALVGMRVFRHKTRKPLFSIGVPIVLLAHIALLVLLFFPKAAQEPEEPDFQEATVEYVVDGDTIDVLVSGEEKRIRLIGIDAPESASHDQELNTAEGQEATEFARTLLPVGTTVYLQADEEELDDYGRTLRYVWLDLPKDLRDDDEVRAKMANALIVSAGYADTMRYWPNVRYADVLEDLKEEAASENRGVSYLWS